MAETKEYGYLLKEAEVAEMLGMSVKRVQQWRSDYYRTGRQLGPIWIKNDNSRYIRYCIDDVKKYMEKMENGG